MSALNATAKATLRAHGVSQAEWARRNYSAGGEWGGDACGCPDDRCIGYHHDGPDDCGCLPALLAAASEHREESREGNPHDGQHHDPREAQAGDVHD